MPVRPGRSTFPEGKGRCHVSQSGSARRALVPSAVLLALGLAVGAGAQVTVSPEASSLQLRVEERGVELTLSREALQGPGISLRRDRSALVGQLHGRPVDIGWSEGPVLGRVGDAPVRLSVDSRTAEPGVLAEGIFAGLAASLTVSPLGISGHVGRCDYSLPQAGSRYEGWRTCGETRAERRPERVTLTLPEEALSLGDTEGAALLALLLSDVTIPPETRG